MSSLTTFTRRWFGSFCCKAIIEVPSHFLRDALVQAEAAYSRLVDALLISYQALALMQSLSFKH